MGDEPKTDKPEHSGRSCASWVWVAAALLVAYPLSMGPAIWIGVWAHLSGECFCLIYAPILFLVRYGHWDSIFMAYINWWHQHMPLPPRR